MRLWFLVWSISTKNNLIAQRKQNKGTTCEPIYLREVLSFADRQTLYLLVRPALRLRFIALQFSIITLALMAMHDTAHAGGEIFPQPVFWQSYNQYAFYPDQNQACLDEAQRESAFQGWAFISVDSCYLNPNDPNYLLGTFSFNARNVTQILQTRMVAGIARVTCPAYSSPSASSNITCNFSDGYFPDPSKTNCVPCLPPDVLNQQTGKCEPPETYVLSLSPETATIEPGKSFQFKATVTKQDGGAPSKAVPVSVKVEVDPISGVHKHGETVATRPKGSVSPATGILCCRLRSPQQKSPADTPSRQRAIYV